MVKYVVLDRRQAVRHWVLVPAFAGSNPAGPAKHKKKTFRSYFYAFVCADRMRTVGSHRAKEEWNDDRIYGTELSMVLNHECWQHYNNGNIILSKLYSELWGEFHDCVLDNWKGEDLQYYLRITD